MRGISLYVVYRYVRYIGTVYQCFTVLLSGMLYGLGSHDNIDIYGTNSYDEEFTNAGQAFAFEALGTLFLVIQKDIVFCVTQKNIIKPIRTKLKLLQLCDLEFRPKNS